MKTAIVTGAARGIGLATADILRSQSWHVIMVDRDAKELQKQAAIRDQITALCHDISDPEQVNLMVKKVMANRGQIDALVDFCYIYIDSESFLEEMCGLALKVVPCH